MDGKQSKGNPLEKILFSDHNFNNAINHEYIVLNASPLILTIEGLFNTYECSQLISCAEDKLKPIDKNSQNSWSTGSLKSLSTPIINLFNHRLEELINFEPSLPIPINISHYKKDHEFKPHFDAYDLENVNALELVKIEGQITVTTITYLSDVTSGGYTYFPKLDIQIKPEIGKVLFFINTDSQGNLDKSTVHGSSPILDGEKWIATKWFSKFI